MFLVGLWEFVLLGIALLFKWSSSRDHLLLWLRLYWYCLPFCFFGCVKEQGGSADIVSFSCLVFVSLLLLDFEFGLY